VKNVDETKTALKQNINIVFPHQLFKNNPLFSCEGDFYLIEEYLFFNQYKFHKKKICFHRSTMKYYENYLIEKGFNVTYIDAQQEYSNIERLITKLHTTGVKKITIIDPVDNWLCKSITQNCKKYGISLSLLDSPMFLNTQKELEAFFKKDKKKYFQAEFYKQERIKRNILVNDNSSPVGEKWSYDDENRKKFPKNKTAPITYQIKDNKFSFEAIQYTNKYYSENLGILGNKLEYPTDFESSEKWLDDFLQNRFAQFGIYEDAIVQHESLLHHSLLSPLLNVGLLTPKQVLDHALEFGEKAKIPLNSLEGFVRQIIGWREFVRGVYEAKGSIERTRNFWGFTRKIPKSFYDGTTGVLPIDETIKKILRTGYCHHIERLMILGNFMVLCEFNPDSVYQWFMEMFIDAYDWVMVPNVYGMSQFADGGVMSTKPYISGSNYLNKMGDYPNNGKWNEIWDTLFWRFMDKNRVFFLKNPRMGMLINSFDKMPTEKKAELIERAEQFLDEI
jgi:deoxyribodipyrimidine photolyase-related protein